VYTCVRLEDRTVCSTSWLVPTPDLEVTTPAINRYGPIRIFEGGSTKWQTPWTLFVPQTAWNTSNKHDSHNPKVVLLQDSRNLDVIVSRRGSKLFRRGSKHIYLLAKLPDYFLRSNKSNINQITHSSGRNVHNIIFLFGVGLKCEVD